MCTLQLWCPISYKQGLFMSAAGPIVPWSWWWNISAADSKADPMQRVARLRYVCSRSLCRATMRWGGWGVCVRVWCVCYAQ